MLSIATNLGDELLIVIVGDKCESGLGSENSDTRQAREHRTAVSGSSSGDHRGALATDDNRTGDDGSRDHLLRLFHEKPVKIGIF